MPNSVVCSQRVPHLCQLYQHVPISLSFSQISPEKRHVVLQKGNSMFWDGSFTTLRACMTFLDAFLVLPDQTVTKLPNFCVYLKLSRLFREYLEKTPISLQN